MRKLPLILDMVDDRSLPYLPPNLPGRHFSACLTLGGKDYTRNKLSNDLLSSATLEHGMRPPVAPKSEWRELMDEMVVVATEGVQVNCFPGPKYDRVSRAT
jgi:hypothetical protein